MKITILLHCDRLVSARGQGRWVAHFWGVSSRVLVLSTELVGQCSLMLPGSQCRGMVRYLVFKVHALFQVGGMGTVSLERVVKP